MQSETRRFVADRLVYKDNVGARRKTSMTYLSKIYECKFDGQMLTRKAIGENYDDGPGELHAPEYTKVYDIIISKNKSK